MSKCLKVFLFVSTLLFPVLGCGPKETNKDIVILCTSDVHCGIDNNIGYASLSAYKKELEKNNYVTLMDSGDAISGDFVGAVSKGEYIIDIMNEVGYDSMVFGNHEFDFGMDILKERVDQFKGDILSCNFKYTGHKENKFNKVKSYKVRKYGPTKIGFVGVTTPYSITDAVPKYFQEDEEFVYTFSNQTNDSFYKCVQDNIDACYKEGATYVILLGHLGEGKQYGPYSSRDVIKNTKGLTAVLDGHEHQVINDDEIDKEGKKVPLLEPGYQMNAVTKLTIKKDQSLEVELIDEIDNVDQHMAEYIASVNEKVDELASKVLATSDLALSINDENGVRKIRNREMPIGNFVSDAYRIVSEAQIGIVNGGGVRANLKEGDVTYKDLMSIHPFGNYMDVAEAKGSQIADYLEYGACHTEKDYYQEKDDGTKYPFGEDGAFAQVSGLKYTIDTSVPSPVVFDENGLYVSIEGDRRVKDIMVLENDSYVPLDLNKTYTLCSHNYLLEDGGGAEIFKGCSFKKKDFMRDYEILVRYMVDVLNGQLSDKYSAVEGRIQVI